MFKKINKKLLAIILGSVFAGIVLTVITNQGVSATSDNSFCISCHDAPEFKENFAVTPHSQVDCLSCHGEGFVHDKVKGTKKFINTMTGKYEPNDYTAMKAEVQDEKCFSCHTLDNISRNKTSLTAHEIYSENNFSCTTCHDEVFMHGKLRDYSQK